MLYSYVMNRNHLALFHAVAQAGGISRGAQRLRVSQPAVSRQIRELEDSLGVRLLERLPRGTRLTDGGRVLAEYAQRQNAIEQEAKRAMEEFRGLRQGRLAVGASMTIGTFLVPRLFGEFQRRHPAIELRLAIANTRRIQLDLLEGAAEIGLTEGVIKDEHFDSKMFLEDELVAVAPRGHRLLKGGPVPARTLCREPFILREEGSGTREVVERALARHGLSVRPALSLASPEAVKSAVISGLGVTIISRLAIQSEVKLGSLGIIPVKNLVLRRPLYWEKLRGKTLSPSAVEFLQLLPTDGRERHSARTSGNRA
jgi:DNA-binding transcriptional LysR family regulator